LANKAIKSLPALKIESIPSYIFREIRLTNPARKKQQARFPSITPRPTHITHETGKNARPPFLPDFSLAWKNPLSFNHTYPTKNNLANKGQYIFIL